LLGERIAQCPADSTPATEILLLADRVNHSRCRSVQRLASRTLAHCGRREALRSLIDCLNEADSSGRGDALTALNFAVSDDVQPRLNAPPHYARYDWPHWLLYREWFERIEKRLTWDAEAGLWRLAAEKLPGEAG